MCATIWIWLVFAVVQCAMAANLKHPSSGPNDVDGMKSGKELVVGSLDTMIGLLQQGTFRNVEILSSKVMEEQLARLRDHTERIGRLELKQLTGCKSTTTDELIRHLVNRVDKLEDRLTLTQSHNEELRREMVSLNRKLAGLGGDETTSDGVRILRRTTRNDKVEVDETEAEEGTKRKCKPTVAFDAFRSKPFHNAHSYLTFDGTTVNTGNAFDPETGKFVVPVKGIYSFNFHGLTQDGSATYVKIVQNGRNVAGAYRRHEGEGDEEHQSLKNVFPSPQQEAGLRRAEGMLAQSVLLELEKDDEVSVFAYHGNLRDGAWHYTHFTGYLI